MFQPLLLSAMPHLIEDFLCQLLPKHLQPKVLSRFRIAFHIGEVLQDYFWLQKYRDMEA